MRKPLEKSKTSPAMVGSGNKEFDASVWPGGEPIRISAFDPRTTHWGPIIASISAAVRDCQKPQNLAEWLEPAAIWRMSGNTGGRRRRFGQIQNSSEEPP